MPSPHDVPSSSAPDELSDTIDAADRPSSGEATPGAPAVPRRGDVATLDYPQLEPVARRHYLMGTEIARGGMGRVVAARDLRLGREVAIKELLPRKRDAAQRFEQEARVTARLQHPAIIHLYEAGVWPGGEPFYTMPRVVGRSLDAVVAERATLAERLGLLPNVIAVADALAYAHSERVMHRDLKPANVLVGEFGETVVIDWGLAKDLRGPHDGSGEIALTEDEGGIAGTPAYMAPEQARGRRVDERTDVYALGALLYTVLVGVAPYTDTTARRVLERVLAGPPPPVRSIEPGVPADLVAIVAKAMARDPADRYPTAAELAADLKRFQTGQLVAAHQYSAGERVRRWLHRHRAPVALAVAAAAALALGAAVSVRSILAEKRTAEHRRAALLEEQGRAQLLAGRAGRALVYFDEAVARGRRGGALSFLVADAMRPFASMVVRLRADGPVHSVELSPDGRHVLTGGDGGAIVWDVATTTQLARLGPSPVRLAAYAPDGGRVVTAGDDGVARVWDLPQGALRHEAARHRGAITDAAFSPDGARFATAGADGTTRIWDSGNGAALAALSSDDGAVTSVRFSPDGLRVATATEDGAVGVWSSRGSVRLPLRGHERRVNTARWSPDGRWILTAGDDWSAVVFDADSGKPVLRLPHRAGVLTAEWSPDGARVVTASADHTARLWIVPPIDPEHPADITPYATLAAHTDIVLRAAFDAAGTRVVTVGRDRTMRLWDAASGDPLTSFEGHADLVDAVAISPDGTLLVTGSRDGTAQVWDAHAGKRAPIDVGEEIFGLALSPDGATVATGTANGEVLLWSGGATEPVATSRHQAPIAAVAFSPDGTRLASGGQDGTALVSDAADPDAHALRLAHGRPVLAVGFSPDGKRIATGCDDGVLRVWDATDGTLTQRFEGHRGAVVAIAWSGDGTRLISGSSDGGARVWDARRGVALGAPLTIGQIVHGVSLSADGRWAAAGGDGSAPQVWRTDGGRGVLALEGPTSVVTAVSLTDDGSRVVTAGVDATIRVWDARSGKLLGVRHGHRGPVRWNGMAVADGGAITATASDDRTVRFWDLGAPALTSAQLRSFVASRVPWCLDDDDQPRRVQPGSSAGGSCDQRR